MVTGTDENGMKIQQTASLEGLKPQKLCDSVSIRFRELAKVANICHDDFIRTTENRHHLAAQHFWREIFNLGHVYKGKYEGWYSVSDETYYSQSQVQKSIDLKSGVSVESGQPVEWIEEDNYMFKLRAFQDRLLEWLNQDQNTLISSQRSNILNQLQTKELNDLSISRPASRLSWGIPVPGDPTQTMYVWMDALVNYLTVTGYPWKSGTSRSWPPDVHVIGKDITKFHSIYWPAMLMAAGLDLPRTVLAHGHWTMKREKMSKSRGNVADPFEAIKKWGVDGVRYYLMRAPGSLLSDTDWAPDRLDEHYRKDLSGQLGNLLGRISAPKLWGRLPPGRKSGTALFSPPETCRRNPEMLKLYDLLAHAPDRFALSMDALEVPKALKEVFDVLSEANRLIQEVAPWHSSSSPEDSHECLYLCAESLRLSGILLQPFIPAKASELLGNLGIPIDRRTWNDLRLGSALGCCVRSDANHLFPKKV
ncbi:tRNA synthetases class I (M)-domain-containing protein [Phakopsora pachyrhizi]|nr:tRNA synthetases class I (M)-domain-containing protein [Phakopsora pachyrhizi]